MLRRQNSATDRRYSGARPSEDGADFYGAAIVGAATIGERALHPRLLDEVLADLEALAGDAYLDYVREFVREGRRRAGDAWRYADITTALAACAYLLRPLSYLELGVRRGRSMAVVARRAPDCRMLGIDLWTQDYAGMENPGPDHVRAELVRLGFLAELELITGDSHVELPRLFAAEPDLTFDLITVDGDHSESGAKRDLQDVLPRLRIGGALVFDDISHPAHPGLRDVWHKTVSDRRYATWEFDDVGFGVAVAVRRW